MYFFANPNLLSYVFGDFSKMLLMDLPSSLVHTLITCFDRYADETDERIFTDNAAAQHITDNKFNGSIFLEQKKSVFIRSSVSSAYLS